MCLESPYIRGLKLNYTRGPHSKEKNATQAAFYEKKAFAGRNLQEKILKKAQNI